MLHYEDLRSNQRLPVCRDLPCGEIVSDADRGRSSTHGAVSRIRITASIVGGGQLSTKVWRFRRIPTGRCIAALNRPEWRTVPGKAV